jgi:activator of HSP90 ATPase
MPHVNEDKDTIKFAGDYNLDVCTIVSYKKSVDNADTCIRHNILPQVLSLSLVEDISLQVITGEINVADAQDIRTVLPITGRTILHIQNRTY